MERFKSSKKRSIASALLCLAAVCGVAAAQAPLLEEVRTIGAEGAAVPFERTFDTATAGNYEITLTDLGAPGAALASVRLAVTQGVTVVGTPLTAAGALTIAGTAGATYSIRVTGSAGSTIGSGLFKVDIRNVASGELVDSFVGILAPPPGTPTVGQFLLDMPFVIASSGNFDVTLRDLQLPQQIPTLLLAVVEEGGSLVTALDTSTGNPALQSVALDSSRQYRLFAVAVPTTPTSGGLYDVDVRPTGGGTAALARTVAVGGVTSMGSITLAAGAHTLTLNDLAFPAALASRAAIVLSSGQSVAQANAGDVTFTAVAGPHDVYAFGEAAPGAIAGSLNVSIAPSGQPAVFSAAHIVALPSSGVLAYTYDAPIANAAGFRVRLADYQFPAVFQLLRLAAVQNGVIVGTPLTAPGTFDIAAAQGRVQLLALAQPTAAGGLFGADVSPTALGAVAFETTQGVGGAFAASRFVVTNSASFSVMLADLGFPARFTGLSAAVTRGADRVGLIFGGGTFNFSATPGTYFLNIVAQPDATEKAGTYGATVTELPPPPVVSLTSSASNVASGGAVDLTWSTQGATSCVASGGWSGAHAVSGTERTAAISVLTTFTLTCTGAGGTAAQSVDVRIADSGGGGGGGGGGGFDPLTLLLASLGVVFRFARRREPA